MSPGPGTPLTDPSGVDDASPWEPVAVERRYDPPRGRIHPDTSRGWIRRMLPLVAAHRRLWLTSLAMAAVALVAQVAIPRVVGAGIDAVIRGGSLTPFVVALGALGLVRGLFTFGYRYGLYRVAYRIEYDLRATVFRHLTRMSFAFYDRQQSGQLISRANSDIRSVQMLLAFAPFMAMTLITFFAGFAIMALIHLPLTLVAISTLPGVWFFGVRMRRLMFPISWIVQSRVAEVATVVEENVQGVRVVKSFNAEARQVRLLARAAQRLRWAAVRQIDVRATYAPVMENLPRLGMAMVLAYGGWLAIDGQITVGDIVVFNQYVIMLQAPFRMLGFFLMMSQRAAASAQRIFEILDTPPEVTEAPGAVDLVAPGGRIALEGVRFGYGDGPDVLRDVSMVVEPGETVAIVGRTGSGKTTIARLIERFYDVRDGAVRVDGHDVRELTLASLRHHIGFVTEEPFLFSASVRDNIAYARPDASDEEVVAAARAACAHEFICRLERGYDTVIGERGYDLSGGQRQRIAIARALLANPRILILDDATSAIDVRIEARIHAALRELMGDRTTIVIAHRLSTIALADRVVFLEDGRVAATGTHAELMATQPAYVEVVTSGRDGTRHGVSVAAGTVTEPEGG